MTFKGNSSCQFYFGTSQHPSYSTPLPVHTGKLNVTGHIYGGSAVQTISTTSGTINLDAEDYGVFRLTSSLTGTTTLNIQNMKSGQVIDVVLTGDQTVNLTSDDTAETFYRIGETTYDGTATNHLQIVCISDANSAAIYHFTVAKIASSSSNIMSNRRVFISPTTESTSLPSSFSARYLVVAGGGSGSGYHYGGGGGAGGMLGGNANDTITLTVGVSYTAMIGGGGSSPNNSQGTTGNDGSSSLFLEQVLQQYQPQVVEVVTLTIVLQITVEMVDLEVEVV